MKSLLQSLNLKLAHQLLTGFVVSIVVVGTGSLIVAYSSLKHDLELQLEERARTITQGLQFSAEGLIEIQDQLLLERLVQNYATLPAVVEVTIVDPYGFIVASSRNLAIKKTQRLYSVHQPQLTQAINQVSRSGTATYFRSNLNGRAVLVDLLPFPSSLFYRPSPIPKTQRYGVAIAILDTESLDRTVQRRFLTNAMVLFTGVIVLGVVFAGLVHRLALGPLARLKTAILARQHQTPLTLPTLPDNEIGELAQALAIAFGQLQAYQQLELDIAERKYQEIAQRYTLATRSTKVWVWDWQIDSDQLELDADLRARLKQVNLPHPCPLKAWIEIMVPEDATAFHHALMEHLAGRSPEFACEHRLLTPGQDSHWYLARGHVVRNQQGLAQEVIGTLTDISERKQAELKLIQANAELSRATRLKDEFLANMSHELRTPLNAILGMTEGLQDQSFGSITPDQQEALATVEQSATHLLSLINDILDIAKIESGQISLEYGRIAPAELGQSSLQFVRQQALKKRLEIVTAISPDLPDIWLDQRRMRQVLINLLINAIKFTPNHGQITLTIAATEQENSRYLQIMVTDTGIGIAPEDISRLFQPFVQIDTALNRQHTGTGLGLVLVKQIVELHGGTITLTSKLGSGSCFTVYLPYKIPTSAAPTQAIALLAPAQAPKPDRPMPLILITEDNESNLLTISNYLSSKGYRVLQARNGYEALDTLKPPNELPHLVLMDMQMPGLDGLATIYEIRHTLGLGELPIIALTALAKPEDQQRCLAAGANNYLSKPVKLKVLVNLIETYLQASGNNPE